MRAEVMPATPAVRQEYFGMLLIDKQHATRRSDEASLLGLRIPRQWTVTAFSHLNA